MASVVRRPKGRYWISFVAHDGRKRTLRLGKCSRRDAEQIRSHVESIISANALGVAVGAQAAAWVDRTCGQFRQRLTRCGLADERALLTLVELAAQAFAGRQIKSSTRTAYATATATLVRHFGAACDLRRITAAGAESYRDALRRAGLREATVRRRCGVARDLFRVAVGRRLIPDNPFAGLPVSVRGSPDRARLVSAAECGRLMDASPDAQWRVLVALGRWGALRVPSEALALRWADVDWGDGARPATLRVRSPKTERYAGGAGRTIPLFPELRGPLEELFCLSEPRPEDAILTRFRGPSQNLRTPLMRIARRAGVALWPKPWVNMRATRDAELRREYPAHVVRQWVGHSERVAQEHYLLAPDEQYLRAAAAVAPAAEAKTEAASANHSSPAAVRRGAPGRPKR